MLDKVVQACGKPSREGSSSASKRSPKPDPSKADPSRGDTSRADPGSLPRAASGGPAARDRAAVGASAGPPPPPPPLVPTLLNGKASHRCVF